jgi:hypothetical protein
VSAGGGSDYAAANMMRVRVISRVPTAFCAASGLLRPGAALLGWGAGFFSEDDDVDV